MITVRIPGDVYREVQQGTDTLSPELALQRGLLSYIRQPKKTKLLLDGTPEERLDDLLLMLAQTRASHGVLRYWQISEEKDHAGGREEYGILADELQCIQQEPLARLEGEIKTLSVQVTQLETKLKTSEADPDRIEPPFPVGISRPTTVPPSASTPGVLGRLWHRVAAMSREG